MDMSTGPKCIEEETVMVEGYMKQTDASDSDEEGLLDLPESCKIKLNLSYFIMICSCMMNFQSRHIIF